MPVSRTHPNLAGPVAVITLVLTGAASAGAADSNVSTPAVNRTDRPRDTSASLAKHPL